MDSLHELEAFVYYVSRRKGDYGLLGEQQAYRFIEHALEQFFLKMTYNDLKAIQAAIKAPPYTPEDSHVQA